MFMNTQSKHLKPGMIFRRKKSFYYATSGLVLQSPSIKLDTKDQTYIPIPRNSFLYLNFKGSIEEYMLYDGVWDWVEVIE